MSFGGSVSGMNISLKNNLALRRVRNRYETFGKKAQLEAVESQHRSEKKIYKIYPQKHNAYLDQTSGEWRQQLEWFYLTAVGLGSGLFYIFF